MPHPAPHAARELRSRSAPFATAYTDFRGRYRVDGVPPDLRIGIVVRANHLVGARWGVRAEGGHVVEDQDVVVSPVPNGRWGSGP